MFLLQVIMVKYVQLQVFSNLSMLIGILYLLTFRWLLGFQNRIEFATWCLNFQSFNSPFFVYLYLVTKSKLLFSKSFLQIILCFNDMHVYVSICGYVIESADATKKGAVDPQELELLALGGSPTWVLRTKLSSSTSTIYTFNLSPVSPATSFPKNCSWCKTS